MRKNRVRRLLAAAALALIVAAPSFVVAAPDAPDVVVPLRPSLDDQTPLHRDTAPPPPPETQPAATATPSSGSDTGSKDTPDQPLGIIDAQIRDKLRALVTGKQLERRINRAPERQAVEAFYAARNFAPLWISDGGLNARADSVIARLKNAAADGLDPADYPVPEFVTARGAEALADDEAKLTQSMLAYARHLATGRIAPTRVAAEVAYGSHTPEPADILRTVADAGDAGAALESFNPPHDGFRALKAKLAELRGASVQAGAYRSDISDGPVIRPGAVDARVPLLRARLHAGGKRGSLTYDNALVKAIRQVQQRANLKPTGLIDAKTIAAINGPKPRQQVARVIANMERWRWLPRDLGRNYVMVNIPDYTLKVVHDQQEQWTTKIIAGKPQTPTPLLTASMDSVLVNPSWHVPQSIIKNELLPRYHRDPNIFSRMGLLVKWRGDGTLNVTQPPGARNALGRIKFNFPNPYEVYLHDTPDKRLFAAEARAFSHGCMRVEDPTKFGEIMLHLAMNGSMPNSQQLSAMFGRGERTFKLTNRPMVHLTYQTAFVNDAGKLVTRDDVYGFDARIDAILHGDDRRVADTTPPQVPKHEQVSVKASQHVLRRPARGEAQKRAIYAVQPRPIPVSASPWFQYEAPRPPFPGPFLAIFGR